MKCQIDTIQNDKCLFFNAMLDTQAIEINRHKYITNCKIQLNYFFILVKLFFAWILMEFRLSLSVCCNVCTTTITAYS